MIWRLQEIPEGARVGGKADTLGKLRRAGFPVPAGFVITPDAFVGGHVRPDAWAAIEREVSLLRRKRPAPALAVRSSAASEDSADASFAGGFATLLNVRSDKELREAIHTVHHSGEEARVAAYVAAKGLDSQQEVAVIVQEMVPSDLAGVLFTVDAVTGRHTVMSGNFVRGLGESLVSGESDGEAFTLERPGGKYEGPPVLHPFAANLFRLGTRLERTLGAPQDIEWAIADGRLYLLQSRPITTLQGYNALTGEWNDSLRGDYLWSNANFGEALPDVMTPLTWSLLQIYAEETFGNPLPGTHPLMGNIGGRLYVNLSLFASMMRSLGFSRERMNRESEEFFGTLPETTEIPLLPFSRGEVLRRFVPFAVRTLLRRTRNFLRLESFTATLPHRAGRLYHAIEEARDPGELSHLWREGVEPLVRRACQMLQTGTSRYENAYRPLRRRLVTEAGERDANLLLSGVSTADENLTSLAPLVGLWQVSTGEMSRESYLQKYGHRGPHELELSWPRPAEEEDWIEQQLALVAGMDIPGLLARRAAEKEQALARYRQRHPGSAARVERALEKAARAARGREAIRSEVTRLFAVARAFAVRAGELTGLGDDIFFLSLDDLIALLEGDERAVTHIPARRAAHERLSALPPYPALIRGRFNPVEWAVSPSRRTDIYDAAGNDRPVDTEGSGLIRGLPGSAGIVEGVVRRLERPEEGEQLRPGEILVATTTNVGWTPLFPRAAAVVTDVGAPLSHAAIIARELGIPAVMGTGNATMRLKNGDHVRVNGTRGTVERLDGAPGAVEGCRQPDGVEMRSA